MDRLLVVRTTQNKEEIAFTLRGLTLHTGLPAARIRQMIREGLITPESEKPLLFSPEVPRRILKIERISSHLGLNLSVMALVMELLDRLESLEKELGRFHQEGTAL